MCRAEVGTSGCSGNRAFISDDCISVVLPKYEV